MVAPLVGLAIGAAARAAARAAAKKVATNAAKKAMTTGKAKKLAEASKKFDPPVKGSGKPKYKNTIKEARVDTKKDTRLSVLGGKRLTKSESAARNRKSENIPKQIAKEEKIRTGVNTAKPATPKVPVKKPKK